MIIDCISDLHGYFPKLKGGDLLLIAGDLTKSDTEEEYASFIRWLNAQKYEKKVVIAGNHDNLLVDKVNLTCPVENIDYLMDSGVEFKGLKIWGSPWTLVFKGMNPRCKAFTVDTEHELRDKLDLIPKDTDILITHNPPHGIFDACAQGDYIQSVGSVSLRNKVLSVAAMPRLKLHVFGHIHEGGGKMLDTTLCKFINASHVDEWYRPMNHPLRVLYEK